MGKSWTLYNVITGDRTMQLGRMSFRLTDGSVEELTEPTEIVAQRIEKCSVEPRGSNRFLRPWGSRFASLRGAKVHPYLLAREIGGGVREIVDVLIAEQSAVARRILLVPGELISHLVNSALTVDVDTIAVEATVAVGKGETVTARTTLTT